MDDCWDHCVIRLQGYANGKIVKKIIYLDNDVHLRCLLAVDALHGAYHTRLSLHLRKTMQL